MWAAGEGNELGVEVPLRHQSGAAECAGGEQMGLRGEVWAQDTFLSHLLRVGPEAEGAVVSYKKRLGKCQVISLICGV